MPLPLDQRARPRPAAPRAAASTVVGAVRRPGQRVRPGGPGEVVEAQAQDHACARPGRAARSRRVTRSTSCDEHGVELGRATRAPAEGPLRADRAPAPADLRRGGDRGCGPGRGGGGPTARRASTPAPARGSSATSPTVLMPRACSFAAVTGPTPQSRSTGSGCRNASSPSGGHHQQAVGLGHAARHLGQELRPRHADGDGAGRPRSRTCRRSATGDLDRRARHPPQPADVEERLVDRDPLDQRRRVLEDREHGLARFRVGRHPRRHHDGLRAEPPGLDAAHGRAHPEGPGLVAGGQHDAAADDHRPPPQPRVVALLDRRVERVEVGVEDRGLAAHEHMFAHGPWEEREPDGKVRVSRTTRHLPTRPGEGLRLGPLPSTSTARRHGTSGPAVGKMAHLPHFGPAAASGATADAGDGPGGRWRFVAADSAA